MKLSTCRRWAAVGVAALTLGLSAPAALADDDDPKGIPVHPFDVQLLAPDDGLYYYYGQGFDRQALLTPRSTPVKWTVGYMPVGFGPYDYHTTLVSPGATRPTTAYFWAQFFGDADPARWSGIRVTFVADDGVALYLDGKEIARANLPAGPLTDSTWATAAPSTKVARAKPVVVDLPVSAFHTDNFEHWLTAEVHANYRNTGDMSFQVSVERIPNKDRVLIPSGASWNARYDSAGTVPAAWKTDCYLETGHIRTAPMGFGTPAVASVLDVQPVSARPLTAYFCYKDEPLFTDGIGDLQITTWANDGIVLYVNGKEVKRVNMPAGPITRNTYATAAPWAAAAMRAPITVTVPHEEFADSGWVVIAAEVHLNWRGTTDMTFDLIARSVPTE